MTKRLWQEMRDWAIILLATILALWLLSGAPRAHTEMHKDVPQEYSQECCHGRDCAPAKTASQDPETGMWTVETQFGKATQDKNTKVRPSTDGRIHACIIYIPDEHGGAGAGDYSFMRCLYMEGGA